MNQNTSRESSPMKLDCTVHPVSDGKNLKAFVSVCFNDCFVVNGLKVMDSQKGLFVAMPNAKNRDGEYKDTCFPVTAAFRTTLVKAVMEAYEKRMEKDQAAEKPDSVRGKLEASRQAVKSQPVREPSGKDKGAR